MAEPILYEVRNRAAWITLNTPQNHNALSLALCETLDACVQRALADPAARLIVLTGVGRTFCAGADLKSAGGGAARREAGAARRAPFVSAIQRLWDSPKPVIGRIQGNAFGGGLGLMAACDIAVAVESGRYAFTEVRLGLIPAIISIFVLRKMTLADATVYFLTGDRFSAEQARALGLVHQVVPEAELDGAVQAIAESLLQGGPQALGEAKTLLRLIPTLSVDAGLDYAEGKIGALFSGAEGQEGMAAFNAKRKPSWAV